MLLYAGVDDDADPPPAKLIVVINVLGLPSSELLDYCCRILLLVSLYDEWGAGATHEKTV